MLLAWDFRPVFYKGIQRKISKDDKVVAVVKRTFVQPQSSFKLKMKPINPAFCSVTLFLKFEIFLTWILKGFVSWQKQVGAATFDAAMTSAQ